MTRSSRGVLLALVAIAFFATAFGDDARDGGVAGGFDLSWHTIDGGGATFSTGGGLTLGGTMGQHDAGPTTPMTGGGFSLTGGFWTGASLEPIDTCPADIAPAPNGNGLVNVDDLLAVINAWGPCGNPNDCPADIAPTGRPIGNDIVNVDDLLAVINAWGTCP